MDEAGNKQGMTLELPENKAQKNTDMLKKEIENQKHDKIFVEIMRVLGEKKDGQEMRIFRNHLERLVCPDISELFSIINSLPKSKINDSTRADLLTNISDIKDESLKLKYEYIKLKIEALEDTGSIQKNHEAWQKIIIKIITCSQVMHNIGDTLKKLRGDDTLPFIMGISLSQMYLENFLYDVDEKLNLGIRKFDLSNRINFSEKINPLLNEHWEKTIKPGLIAEGMAEAQIGEKYKSFEKFLTRTKMGEDICKRLVQSAVSPISLLMMAFYLHEEPDRDKAAVRYLTFLLAGEWVQREINLLSAGLKALSELAIKLLPENAPFIKGLQMLCKKGKGAGALITIALVIGVLMNPKISSWLTDKADDFSDNFLDSDNIGVWTVSQLLSFIDIPFSMIGDTLNYVGINLPNPRTDQLNWMKKNVQNYFDPVARGGEVLKVGQSMIENWNGMIDQNIAKSTHEKEKKLFALYRVDNVEAWGKRQMLEFSMRYMSIQNTQNQLEKILQEKGVINHNEKLTYLDIATKEQSTTDLREDIVPNIHRSNARSVQWIEDDGDNDKNNVIKKVKDFCMKSENGEIKILWRQLSSQAFELGREVDVYNHLGIYKKDIWCHPFDHTEGMSAVAAQSVWEDKKKYLIKLDGKSDDDILVQTREIEALIPTDTEGFFSWVMSDKQENNDLERMKKGIGGILSEFVTMGVSREVINSFIEKYVTSITLHEGRISFDALARGHLNLVKEYFRLTKNTDKPVPQCIRDYIPRGTEFNVDKTPPYGADEATLMAWYVSEKESLKSADISNWTQMEIMPKNGSEIKIFRKDFNNDSFTMKRSGTDWGLESDKYGPLAGKFGFHEALALANLAMYYMNFLDFQVHKKVTETTSMGSGWGPPTTIRSTGDNSWRSESGKSDPFYFDSKKGIMYHKNELFGLLDIALMKKKNGPDWTDFYFNQLKINPSIMVALLNDYFSKIGPTLGLLGEK